MAKFTFEFLPHYAGGLKRNADFSLYEVKWNNYGEYGCFELQFNIPSFVGFNRTVHNTTLLSDVSAQNVDGKWPKRRLTLYEQYKGQVLKKLPNDIFMSPAEWLLIRLILSFSKEDRLDIAEMLNFRFREKMDSELIQAFMSDDSIFRFLNKYHGYFSL